MFEYFIFRFFACHSKMYEFFEWIQILHLKIEIG